MIVTSSCRQKALSGSAIIDAQATRATPGSTRRATDGRVACRRGTGRHRDGVQAQNDVAEGRLQLYWAAYAIVRLRYRGAQWVGGAIFLAYLVPPSILFIPLSTVVFQYGLFDTPFALILTYPTILIPFSTWLLMGYFKTIPFELEECALIDGATRLQILVKIILPLAVPGLISAGIFAFTLSWNEFIYALTFVSSSEVKTVPVGVVTELVDWPSAYDALLTGRLAKTARTLTTL